MSSTPSNRANTGLIKLTPSNSPYSRPLRSPNRARSVYESSLSLKRIIGTTVCSPTAFDSLSSSRIFAYTAGAAAVVVNVDDTSKYAQRFFRARPTAIPLNSINANSFMPSTPSTTANDGRNRVVGWSIRDSALPYSPSTPHANIEWGDSPSSKTWTSRERIKAATCLSISRDGKFLAVGETGYSPRVLLFSLQDNSSDCPLVVLNEHTYGVRAVAFSPNSRYLASLGATNDGFLYIWSINQKTGAAKLHSSNKCTSVIKQMLWLGNRCILTVGTRHIKIWRIEENQRSVSPSRPRYNLDGTPIPVPAQPLLKTLAGRNVLLGALVEATFTTLAVISDHRAIVCSEKGDVCLIDIREGQKLLKLTNTGFFVTCVAVDMEARRVRIGGKNGKIKSMCLDDLLVPDTPPNSPTPSEEFLTNEFGHICAMGYAGRSLVTVDSNHLIEISSLDSDNPDPCMQNTPFPAHGDAVLGVRLMSENHMNAAFLTWSANGTVVFWDLEGNSKGTLKVELEQQSLSDDEVVNQCLTVRISKSTKFLVTGDRYGVLRIIEPMSHKSLFETRAHSSDINCIALLESADKTLISSCSRDRTIQLFRLLSEQWALIQTLDDHSASVTGLIFDQSGEKLVSSSTDRTVQIRQVVKRDVAGQEMVVILPLRIITLKASPVSIAPCFADQAGNIIVSLLDRTVATYEMCTGRLITSFRATDNDGVEAVALDSLVIGMPSLIPGRPTILAGASSTDKSVRVYDGSTGFFLDREWGHTTNVTDVALLENPRSDTKTLISTGSDGTIMIWSLAPKVPELLEPNEDLNSIHDGCSLVRDTSSSKPPLRRVLSRAELAEFQRPSNLSLTARNPSPPRVVRKKTSKYNLSGQSPSLIAKAWNTGTDDSRRTTARTRSRSPPRSPKEKILRRASLASIADTKARTRSTEFGTLNMATEQACRTLRAYRKKLLSSESVKENTLKELDQELRLTAVALGEKSQKSKTISETVLTCLLDEYSERLVSMFDEKLRLSRQDLSETPMGESDQSQMAGSTGVDQRLEVRGLA